MAEEQWVEVTYIGGPSDGETSRVPAGPDGQPPELYLPNGVGPVDWSILPSTAPMAELTTEFYTRDLRTGPSGPFWVYVYEGEYHLPRAA